MIFYEIFTNKELNIIPTSICCLQDEEEIVLIPGTKFSKTNQLEKISLDHVFKLLENENLQEASEIYVKNFFQEHGHRIRLFLLKLEI